MFVSVESIRSHLLAQKEDAYEKYDACPCSDPANTFYYLGRASGLAYAISCISDYLSAYDADAEEESDINVY